MLFGQLSYCAVSYNVVPFDIFESAQAAHVKVIQSIAITDGQVQCLTAIKQHRGDQGTFCREMQLHFHRALESLFLAPAALQIREVISASIEQSAEMIEPKYVNGEPNSISSPSMFIGVVISEEGEIITALVLVQLIDIPTLVAFLLRIRSTEQSAQIFRGGRE